MVEYFGEAIKYPKKLCDMSQNIKMHPVSMVEYLNIKKLGDPTTTVKHAL